MLEIRPADVECLCSECRKETEMVVYINNDPCCRSCARALAVDIIKQAGPPAPNRALSAQEN